MLRADRQCVALDGETGPSLLWSGLMALLVNACHSGPILVHISVPCPDRIESEYDKHMKTQYGLNVTKLCMG